MIVTLYCSPIATKFAVRFREIFTYRSVSRTADVGRVIYDNFSKLNNDQINQQKKLTLVKQVSKQQSTYTNRSCLYIQHGTGTPLDKVRSYIDLGKKAMILFADVHKLIVKCYTTVFTLSVLLDSVWLLIGQNQRSKIFRTKFGLWCEICGLTSVSMKITALFHTMADRQPVSEETSIFYSESEAESSYLPNYVVCSVIAQRILIFIFVRFEVLTFVTTKISVF